jgi:hypothetical protein
VDASWLKLGKIHVATVYRSPTADLDAFLLELGRDVALHKHVVIGGDLNVHTGANGDPVTDEGGRRVLRWARTNHLVLVNLKQQLCTGQFSREQPKAKAQAIEQSTVDYVLVSESVLPSVVNLALDSTGQFGSDHKPLVLTIRLAAPLAKAIRPAQHYAWRTPSSEQQEQFTAAMEAAASDFVQGLRSLDSACGSIAAVTAAHVDNLLVAWHLDVLTAGKRCIGRKRIRHNGQSKRWFDAELRSMRSSVDSLRVQLIRAKDDQLMQPAEHDRLWAE